VTLTGSVDVDDVIVSDMNDHAPRGSDLGYGSNAGVLGCGLR